MKRSPPTGVINMKQLKEMLQVMFDPSRVQPIVWLLFLIFIVVVILNLI